VLHAVELYDVVATAERSSAEATNNDNHNNSVSTEQTTNLTTDDIATLQHYDSIDAHRSHNCLRRLSTDFSEFLTIDRYSLCCSFASFLPLIFSDIRETDQNGDAAHVKNWRIASYRNVS